MRKPIFLLCGLLSAGILLVSALTACGFQTVPDDAVPAEDLHADSKSEAIEMLNGFTEATVKNRNMVVTLQAHGRTRSVFHVLDDAESILSENERIWCFTDHGSYMYACETAEEDGFLQYDHCSSDPDAPDYSKRARELYDASFLSFLDDLRIPATVPEEDSVFHCETHTEKKGGVTYATLTFEYSRALLTRWDRKTEKYWLKARSEDGLLRSLAVSVSNPLNPNAGHNISMTFEYGTARIVFPDLDAWDRILEERRIQQEANEQALEKFNDFLSPAVTADNMVVTVSGPNHNFTETVANGIDRTDYGDFRTYGYWKPSELADGAWDFYYVFESAYAKHYQVRYDGDPAESDPPLWYDLFQIDPKLVERGVIACTVSGDTMVLEIQRGENTEFTASVERVDGRPVKATVTSSKSDTHRLSFKYGTGDLSEPDLTGYERSFDMW